MTDWHLKVPRSSSITLELSQLICRLNCNIVIKGQLQNLRNLGMSALHVILL